MRDRTIRVAGLVLSIGYATLIIWMYVNQPQTLAEVTGGLAAEVGAYRIDQRAFAEGLELFRRDQFEAARASFHRADPAERDAQTQFYVAYSYYRSGWGRFYHDDGRLKQALVTVDRAIALAPNGRLIVDDPELGIHNADELRAEILAGLRTDVSDFNPLRVFRERK